MPGRATTPERPLRRDAQANRERIVAAARAAFAADGIEVPVEEIARRAGVGMGTLYRHFPTKEDLVDAVLEDAFAEFVALAEQALAEEDAWAGFSGFLEQALRAARGQPRAQGHDRDHEHGRERAQAMREHGSGRCCGS